MKQGLMMEKKVPNEYHSLIDNLINNYMNVKYPNSTVIFEYCVGITFS